MSAPDRDGMLAEWDQRRSEAVGKTPQGLPIWPGVRAYMERFRHQFLYQVSPADVKWAAENTASPYEFTTASDSMKEIENATSIAPLNLTLHTLLEEFKRVPLWEDFEWRIMSKPSIYLDYLQKHHKVTDAMIAGDWLKNKKMRAVRWRLAKLYCSWIREVHLMASLIHQYRLPIRHHFLMDAEWKQDFCCGDAVVELYVISKTYKSEDEGRKTKAQELNTLRPVIVEGLPPRHSRATYNMPWLCFPSDISKLADRLRPYADAASRSQQAA